MTNWCSHWRGTKVVPRRTSRVQAKAFRISELDANRQNFRERLELQQPGNPYHQPTGAQAPATSDQPGLMIFVFSAYRPGTNNKIGLGISGGLTVFIRNGECNRYVLRTGPEFHIGRNFFCGSSAVTKIPEIAFAILRGVHKAHHLSFEHVVAGTLRGRNPEGCGRRFDYSGRRRRRRAGGTDSGFLAARNHDGEGKQKQGSLSHVLMGLVKVRQLLPL